MTDTDTPGAPPPPPPPRRGVALALQDARAVADAALAHGTRLGLALAVAVVDEGGHLITLARADGSSFAAIDVCQVKARTAVMFGAPTDQLPSAEPMVSIMAAAATGPIALLPGGVPLIRDGILVGAVGVGGARPDLDGQAAGAAAEACGS